MFLWTIAEGVAWSSSWSSPPEDKASQCNDGPHWARGHPWCFSPRFINISGESTNWPIELHGSWNLLAGCFFLLGLKVCGFLALKKSLVFSSPSPSLPPPLPLSPLPQNTLNTTCTNMYSITIRCRICFNPKFSCMHPVVSTCTDWFKRFLYTSNDKLFLILLSGSTWFSDTSCAGVARMFSVCQPTQQWRDDYLDEEPGRLQVLWQLGVV